MEILLCPKWFLNRLPLDRQSQVHLNFLLSVLMICLMAPLVSKIPHVCLAQWLLNLPCPGCGITHSLMAMGRLQLREAWRWNPAGIVLAIYLTLQICARAVALGIEATGTAVSRFSKYGERFVLSALFAVWFMRLIHL